MNIDISKFTFEEILELNNQLTDHINSYKDGYVYICEVRSNGRNWSDKFIQNTHTLQELCYRYDGEDGIVDIYSTNPDLSGISNYGSVLYIRSIEDYEKWREYEYLKNLIPEIEKELDEWENRDNVPFRERPYFAPIYDKEDLDKMKKKLEEFDMSFVAPVPYVKLMDNNGEL